MKVALTFRIFMMRYGNALLATSYTNPNQISYADDISKKISKFLTEKRDVPEDHFEYLKDYLYNKPGSPRYTPLRRAIEQGLPFEVEHQDILLSNSTLPSSVGALTKDYFDDALTLAQTLKLVKRDENLLLARGRLSLSTSWSTDNPFLLSQRDALYLGLWLLDVDCDWLWAFLGQIPDDPKFEISTGNRIELLLESWQNLLATRRIRSSTPLNTNVRARLNELVKITKRNRSEKLNIGQPWSWFLIPRLELMVDAGILRKKKRHGLTGYSLTSAGLKFRSICDPDKCGKTLINNYFFCHSIGDRVVAERIPWNAIEIGLKAVSSELITSVGYFPIFETASALCVSQYLNSGLTNEPIWEVERVVEKLRDASKGSPPRTRLAVDRQGKVYAFKLI